MRSFYYDVISMLLYYLNIQYYNDKKLCMLIYSLFNKSSTILSLGDIRVEISELFNISL